MMGIKIERRSLKIASISKFCIFKREMTCRHGTIQMLQLSVKRSPKHLALTGDPFLVTLSSGV